MTTELQKTLALDQELFNAVRLIKAGLGQLQALNAGNDFYHLPLLTLANGFERFMKVTLCFRWLEVHGSFPTSKAFPSGRNGHDLKFLLERIRTECFLDDYVDNIPVAKADVEYLNSKELLSFISVLSDFGQAARYYNLDVVVGRNVQTEDPDAAWQRLETEILLARKDLMDEIANNPASAQVHIEVNNEVVSRLERFARALARLYTIGKIGVEARRYLGYIGYFLHLSDSDLGTKKYELSGSAL